MSSSSASQPLLPASAPPPPVAEDEYADPGARAIDLSERPVADSLREIMASSPRLASHETSPPPLPPPREGVNRHWTLAAIGLLVLVPGFFRAGETVWRVVSQMARGLPVPPEARADLLVVNPLLMAWLLVLGVGLIIARRWARHLCLATMTAVLLWSLISASAFFADNAQQLVPPWSPSDPDPGWLAVAVLGISPLVSWLVIALLSHRNVRFTCELAQPEADWTDRRLPSELILLVMLLATAAGWAGLAMHHPWPAWGEWRDEHASAVWGGAAAVAALAGVLVALGRPAGSWLALISVAAAGTSIAVTVQRAPAEAHSAVWGSWPFGARGALVYTIGAAAVTAAVSLAAWRAACRRRAQRSSSEPASTTPPAE